MSQGISFLSAIKIDNLIFFPFFFFNLHFVSFQVEALLWDKVKLNFPGGFGFFVVGEC